MKVVFDTPTESGCYIFDNPLLFIVEVNRGGGRTDRYLAQIKQEDDELIIIIMTLMETIK